MTTYTEVQRLFSKQDRLESKLCETTTEYKAHF